MTLKHAEQELSELTRFGRWVCRNPRVGGAAFVVLLPVYVIVHAIAGIDEGLDQWRTDKRQLVGYIERRNAPPLARENESSQSPEPTP